MTGTVTFAANSATADILIQSIDNAVRDGNRAVTLTVGEGAGYRPPDDPGSPYLTITDDEVASGVYWVASAPGSWSNPLNWSTNSVPTATDAVYFASGSANCTGLGGSYVDPAELHVTSGYGGTITLTSSISVRDLELRGGTLDQDSGADVTVTAAMLWTGGTLNSTSNLQTVYIDGATASIKPGIGNTLDTASTLKFQNGAQATIETGTLRSTQDTDLIVGTGSTLTTTDVSLVSAVAAPSPIPVESGATYTAIGVTSDRGLSVEAGGTVFIKGGKTSKFKGDSGHPAGGTVLIQKDALLNS